MIARPCLLIFLFVPLLGVSLASAQVRLGIAHRLESASAATEPSPVVTHDPDTDGALIGAGVGAAGLGLAWGVTCDQGNLCPLAVAGGIIVGGLAGMLVGAAIDAADPLTSSEDDASSDSLATRDPSATPADSIGSEVGRGTACSRRNDFIGAGVGGGISYFLLHSMGWKFGVAAGFIGAAVGAGIGSAIPEGPDEQACASSRNAPRPADSPR